MTSPQQDISRVFISSTSEDLGPYREAAKEAAVGAEMLPVMMEYFTASGDRPPLSKCLAEVDRSDLLIVIVGHRYGWVPPDPANVEQKSITWLECEQAVAGDHEVLAFIVDDKQNWPEQLKESYRLTKAMQDGAATPELFTEVNDYVSRLQQLKAWFNNRAIRNTFTTPENLRRQVSAALSDWRTRHATSSPAAATSVSADPSRYLRWLLEQTSHIDIRGLQVGSGRVHRFHIEELFITLTTTRAADGEQGGKARLRRDPAMGEDPAAAAHVALHTALQSDRLVVVGDPGAGKTTFLWRVACALCQTRLGEVPDAASARLGIADRTFPIFVRLSELANHIQRYRSDPASPTTDDSPAWLPRFVAAIGVDAGWDMDEEFFRRQLESGGCTVLFDGLDEAPDRVSRENLTRLIEQATGVFAGCRFVVTSRPAAYTETTVLPAFAHATIDPLADDATDTFLTRWCEALYGDSTQAAATHCEELLTALHARPDIRRMARNPVMLTALAVVHWNERRLPEQRADLYESIIRWLSRSREKRPERASADRTVRLLLELALAMQNHRDGMQLQVPKRWAAEVLAEHFSDDGGDDTAAIAAAEEFLNAEELDSGIIVGRGNNVQFWHRAFQEFMAARAIASRTEARQHELLWKPKKVYLPEWRDVLLLLAGVLYQQGDDKVDGLVAAMIDDLGDEPSLPEQARCVGLVGAIVRDLSPFDYQPPGSRFTELLHNVQAIFDVQRAHEVDVRRRVEAADALGQAGDPRIDPRAQRRAIWKMRMAPQRPSRFSAQCHLLWSRTGIRRNAFGSRG